MLEKYCEMEILTEKQQKDFELSDICHICQKNFEFTELKVFLNLKIELDFEFYHRSEIMITSQENFAVHHMYYAISTFLIKKIFQFLLII